MQLPADVKNITKVLWSRHAARGGLTFGLAYYHLWGYIKQYPNFIGDRLRYVLEESHGQDWMMWRNDQDTWDMRKRLSERCSDISFVRRCYKKIRASMDAYIAFAGYLKKADVWNMSTDALIRLYEKYVVMIPYGTISDSTIIELAAAMGVRLEQQLLSMDNDSIAVKNRMMVLGAPVRDTMQLEEELKFLRLITLLRKTDIKKLSIRQTKLIEKHFNAYRWLTVYFGGQPWAWNAFLQRIHEAQGSNVSRRLRTLRSGHRVVRRQTSALVARYHLRSSDIALFKELMFWRIQMENYYSLVNYHAMPLQQALAQRLNLSTRQLSFLLLDEVKRYARGQNRIRYLNLIAERADHYVMVTGTKRIHLFCGKKAVHVMDMLPKERYKQEKIREIRGVCGQPGKVRGQVRVVVSIRDLDKVKSGEILVTMNTTPMFVPAMKKSSAIITDEGGITCHAAIVARELGIPCVIGTKIATQVLKTGDRVKVDAGSGMVKKIK